MSTKTKGIEVGAGGGLTVDDCKRGTLYTVTGYHTGDFEGTFVRVTGRRTGEFRITKHPELVGSVVDVPHHLACIKDTAAAVAERVHDASVRDATFGG